MTQESVTGTAQSARLGTAGAAVTVAGAAVNAFAFVVPVLAARRLTSADLSALAAVLALGALASVPALGLQFALAVRWAKGGAVPNALRATTVTAAATAGAVLLATPLISKTLHLSTVLPLLLALTTAAVVVGSRWLGELQGQQRFVGLAGGMVLLAVGRYGGVIGGLAVGVGVTGSLALGALVAWLSLPVLAALARRNGSGFADAAGAAPLRARDVTAASGATLATLAISYADLILARHVLPVAESGAYAVGAVLTKGALWAPQVVTVLALPLMARGSRRALPASLAAVATCGAALVLAAAVAGGLAARLAGGTNYSWLGGYAAGFGAVGAMYAIVFVFVNAEIAAGVRWPAAPLWIALVGITVATLLLKSPTLGEVLNVSLVTAAFTIAVMSVRMVAAVVRTQENGQGREA